MAVRKKYQGGYRRDGRYAGADKTCMRILMLSCSTGGGHNSAGNAVKEEFERRGIYCEMQDPIALRSKRAAKAVAGAYVGSALKAPRFFGALYQAGMIISSDKLKSVVYLANKSYAGALKDYAEKNGFDAVGASHLFPAEAMTALRRGGGFAPFTFGVMTDYCCTPFWEETQLDLYFTPSPDVTAECVKRGMTEERLIPTGIPVSGGGELARGEAKARLGIAADKKMLLVMSGSMGFGNMEALIGALLARADKDALITVLTGNNAKLRETLLKRFADEERLKVVKFTREVPLYLRACDVVMSKPGGLTSTEAAVAGAPLIHTAPIPGCETSNANYFSSRGMSVKAVGIEDISEAACALANDAFRQREMSRAQEAINKSAAADICDRIVTELGARNRC